MAISGTDLLARIDAGNAPAILDVRSTKEFARGHVPGAIHIPFASVDQHVSEIPGSPRDPVVVYCGHGPRAWFAGRALRRHGFEQVMYLKGHMHGWRQAGLREETEGTVR